MFVYAVLSNSDILVCVFAKKDAAEQHAYELGCFDKNKNFFVKEMIVC
jgi:hypothetical protein